MSYLRKDNYIKSSEYNVIYSDMRGVDFSESGSGISRNRFAYLENMYRDYDGDGAGVIESIPGYRRVFRANAKINGLYSYKNSHGKDIIVVHANDILYELPLDDIDNITYAEMIGGVENNESDAFCCKDALFVIDGKNILKMSSDYMGNVADKTNEIYIPTTHINGEEYEQRNLLTRYFYEKYNISSSDSLSFGTPSLKYCIIDEENRECAVYGISDESEKIYIPSRVLIGNTYYSVKKIENYAFRNNRTITECYIANGVTYIGVQAFQGCYNLQTVILSDTVTEIADSCFMDCENLSRLHFGLGLRTLGNASTSTCVSLEQITYAGNQSQYGMIENTDSLGSTEIIYDTAVNSLKIGIKLHNPCISVAGVTIDGVAFEFDTVTENGICTQIGIPLDDKHSCNGKTVTIKGILSSDKMHYSDIYSGFVSSAYSGSTDISAAITQCKIAESFDGRIFLTGNPEYPGFCFYSAIDITGENNPLYFGEMNYFKDGVGNFGNIALLAAGDSLAVFKERDDGGGSIYYHTPKSTDSDIIPKIYPVSYVHSGFSAKGRAISFFDDPVFVSSKGISALSKRNINLERSIVTRSTNVNHKLLSEDLSSIKLAVWQGYLVVLSGDKIYLADSRSVFTNEMGELEYEWYYLKGIGSYENDERVFKYSSTAHDGFFVHSDTDSITDLKVFSISIDGEMIYFVKEDGKQYEVYATGEWSGGDFYAATHIISVDDRLIFAASNGEVFIFNNDKRGVAPPHVTELDGFDSEEYKASYGRQIHPYYYSFAGHSVRYAVQTKMDDCSIPHLLKSTVKNSLSIKCRAVSSGKIICEVGTDNDGYREITRFPNKDLFFSDIDFSNFSLSTQNIYTVPIHEKTKGWIEKQVTLYSDEYASPFGVYIIAYRFSVKGKIKRNR